jgi:tetratricopeptide (TPR) repeat protein
MVIEALSEYGQLMYYLGRYDEAYRVLLDGTERANRILGPEHDKTITLREALAISLSLSGRYSEALARHDTALAIKREEGAGASLLASIMRSGRVLLEMGRLQEAGARFDEGLAMTEPTSVYRILALRGSAQVAQRQGRYAEAERMLNEGLAIATERLRPTHRYTLGTQRAMACLMIETGRYADAATLLEGVLAAERTKFREPHPEIGHTLHHLGAAYLGLADYGRADGTLRLALANYAALPSTHWQVGDATSLLGASLLAQGQDPVARQLLEDGQRIVRNHVGPDTWQARRVQARLQ